MDFQGQLSVSTEHPHPYHESLTLKNFTAFEEASFEFVPGINVFIGENGTGKTHVMKVLYGIQTLVSDFRARKRRSSVDLTEVFGAYSQEELFRVSDTLEDRVGEIAGAFGGRNWAYPFSPESSEFSFYAELAAFFGTHPIDLFESGWASAVYIPSINMIAHTEGFLSTFERFDIDFDRTTRDIVVYLLSPELRSSEVFIWEEISNQLQALLPGNVVLEGERFFVSVGKSLLSMPLVAEGSQKIATLDRLLRVGALEPGTTLFWDEPEVGLNPKLMDELVKALILLARSGVQIFLTTHSYVILKELDLQIAEDDPIRYFLFEPTESSGTKVTPFDTLAEVHPNPILEQYNDLYDREITRKTGRKKAQ